jgi:phosphocarrier protein
MRVNGKSILAILTLAAERGTEVMLEVDGEDESEAVGILRAKLENTDA